MSSMCVCLELASAVMLLTQALLFSVVVVVGIAMCLFRGRPLMQIRDITPHYALQIE